MTEIESEPGTHISEMARRLCNVAADGEDVFTIFNDICVTASKHSTVESVVADYDRLCAIRRAEYQRSPEGMARTAKDAKDKASLQAYANRMMAKLPTLDFTNLDELIDWLASIEDARDRIGVTVDGKLIQSIFKSHGFEPNAYCGDSFVKGNPDIERRWLIGQAIADVYVPLVRSFVERLAQTS